MVIGFVATLAEAFGARSLYGLQKVRVNEWEFAAGSMVTFMYSRAIGQREESESYSGT